MRIKKRYILYLRHPILLLGIRFRHFMVTYVNHPAKWWNYFRFKEFFKNLDEYSAKMVMDARKIPIEERGLYCWCQKCGDIVRHNHET